VGLSDGSTWTARSGVNVSPFRTRKCNLQTVLDMRGSNPLSRSMDKCKCGNEIHPVRIKYGYKNCVACSTVEKYGCAPIINHKTGNSIEILSREDAKRIAKLTRRKGYGTMLR
jgi:hypothetical protein